MRAEGLRGGMDDRDGRPERDANADGSGGAAPPVDRDGTVHEGTETRYYSSDAGLLTIVPAETGGCITHEVSAVEARCPYETFQDVYDLTIVYRPGGNAVEIASLRRYCDQFAGVEISHEAFCETVFGDLRALVDPVELTVTATCNRYHGIVTTVERSTE